MLLKRLALALTDVLAQLVDIRLERVGRGGLGVHPVDEFLAFLGHDRGRDPRLRGTECHHEGRQHQAGG